MRVLQNTKTGSTALNSITSKSLFWIFTFSILTAVSAQITVPVKPVPFTLQTMMVVLSGAFLGAKKGFYSQMVYLGLGIIGLPVFAHTADGTIGFARLIGPTGGYLLSFPLAAFLTGYLIEKSKNYFYVVFSMFLANVIILITGALYLDLLFIHNLSESLKIGAAIFSLWTVIKVIASASIYFGIRGKSSIS